MSHELPDRFWALSTTSGLFASRDCESHQKEGETMAATEVVPGLYMLALGPVNAFLLVASDGCTVIDTGLPRNAAKLMDALKAIKQTNVRRVLLTHAHPDHIGSFAALKNITGAETYMHRADAPIAISGKGFRPMKAAPGLLRGLMFRLFVRPVASVEERLLNIF